MEPLVPQPLYLHQPTYQTPEIERSVEAFQSEWLPKHKLPVTQQLFHYTTLEGMKGIIMERALRFTDATSLNDPSEIQYGQRMITEALTNSIQEEDSREMRSFFTIMSVHVNAFADTTHHPFVACFCRLGNLLSQWRSYSDRGGGYSLGFQVSDETRFASNILNLQNAKAPYLRRIIYEEQEQQALVRNYLDCVSSAAREALTNAESEYSPGAIMGLQAVNPLLDILVSFKHPAFKEEEEWRLIRTTMKNHESEYLRFREVDGGLVAYRPTYLFDISPNSSPSFPLRSVRFGPMHEPARTASGLRHFVEHVSADQHSIHLAAETIRIEGSGFRLK